MLATESSLTDGQYVALIVSGMASSLLSILGSSCIIFICLQGKRYAKNTMYRLLLGLSTADCILSCGLFVSPFLLPSTTGLIAASGNVATCSFLGVTIQWGICVALYNLCLTIYFLRSVKTAGEAISKRAEISMHVVAIAWPVCTSIAALSTQSFNLHEASLTCSTTPHPNKCVEVESIECTRGGSVSQYLSYAYVAPVVLACFISIINTIRLYCTVRRFDKEDHAHSKAVAMQSLWYTLNFCNTFAWPVIFVTVAETTTTSDGDTTTNNLFALHLITNIIYPLQGFFNFWIYARVRVPRWRKANPEQSFWWTFCKIFSGERPPTTIAKSSTAGTTATTATGKPRSSGLSVESFCNKAASPPEVVSDDTMTTP